MDFIDLGFKQFIYQTIDKLGFETPTSIQEKTIPLLKRRRNVVALAHTGTGKTHAFLLPIMNNLDLNIPFEKRRVQAVIVAPTRELAKQIYDNILEFKKFEPKINAGLYIGGEDISKTIDQLANEQPTIVVGTPTRIRELYELRALKLTTTDYMIVDECDMIFDLGFIEDVDFLLSKMRKEVITGLFSATIKEELRPFFKRYLTNSFFIDDSNAQVSNKNIEHILIDIKNKEIDSVISRIIKSINVYMCIIFVNNKTSVPHIIKLLRENGITEIGELHGDLQPRTRINVLKKIKNQEFKYVVATDIAARGVDIKGVSHIISIDLPKELNYYIHRSGRTGRNKMTGISYVILDQRNIARVNELKKMGIEFKNKKFINDELIDLVVKEPKKKEVKLDTESQLVIAKYKNQKVKPGYKQKRKQELDTIKQKRRREHIKESITKIKKAKYQKRRTELFED